MTTSDENNVSEIKKIIESENLRHMDKAYKSDDVIMDEEGYLHSQSNIPDSTFDQKRQELGRRRKNLVLGFNQHEEHTLKQANKIVEMEWENFKEESDVSVIDSMKMVVEDIV